MRVLHVYRTYFPDTQGGAEEVVRQICQNTNPHGIESRVCTLSANPWPAVVQLDDAEVHRFSQLIEIASCGISLSALGGFRKLVDWADVVHYHFPWPFLDFLHFAGRVRKPTLVTYHSDIIRQQGLLRLYRPLMRAFLNSVDAIVATSANYFATSDILGRYSEKVDVIPIGLGNSSYPVAEPIDVDRMREQVGEGFFLFIGVLRYYKGLHILLDAIRHSDLRVVIAGAGPVESELKQHAARLQLNNVQFLGYVSDEDKVALFKLSRAVVFPSYLRSEAFGVTLVEGAMFGKPLISTEIGTGTSYVNCDGETGIVVPPSDSRRLREAMETLAADEALAEQMGQAARLRYEQLFTGQIMGEQYTRLYGRLVSK